MLSDKNSKMTDGAMVKIVGTFHSICVFYHCQ